MILKSLTKQQKLASVVAQLALICIIVVVFVGDVVVWYVILVVVIVSVCSHLLSVYASEVLVTSPLIRKYIIFFLSIRLEYQFLQR